VIEGEAVSSYTKIVKYKRIDAAFARMRAALDCRKEAKLIAEEFSASDYARGSCAGDVRLLDGRGEEGGGAGVFADGIVSALAVFSIVSGREVSGGVLISR
jgi:hypothetical protein